MKKKIFIILLLVTSIDIFALSVDSTVVPWTVGLRIREAPETPANASNFLGLWEKLTVLEIRNEQITINGNTGNWVKIRRENSMATGWCFSYFLEEIDINNFFPILEYRGTSHYVGGTGGGSREIYTLYNNGRKREKLVLYWNNKAIDIYNNVTVSDNGRVIAFNWIDPTTIVRNSRDSTMSGTKYLFVYNFSNHNLTRIDEVSIIQSDINSQRWADERWYAGHGDYVEGFFLDNSIDWFIINSNGTKLFYEKVNSKIEVNLLTGNRVNHSINTPGSNIIRYIGNYIYLAGFDNNESSLYDPGQKRMLTELGLYSRGNHHDGVYYRSPIILSRNRYLVMEQKDTSFSGIILHDLTTNQQQRLNEPELSHDRNVFNNGVYHSRYYSEDYYYIMSNLHKRGESSRTVEIRRVDYRNNIVSQYTFNNVVHRIGSGYSFSIIISSPGIISFQHSLDQAWMIIYLFNNNLLEYRLDDRRYSGSYSHYLMNNY
ncbi:MAG: hypothetical protein LBI28_07420 [Treponema sp.]|jgi:hypothetical protein|nr:hypothetical protein [Treponema sp.]